MKHYKHTSPFTFSIVLATLAITLGFHLVGCATKIENKNSVHPASVVTPPAPVRITDDMGRVWELCGENQWCCISVPENIFMREIERAF